MSKRFFLVGFVFVLFVLTLGACQLTASQVQPTPTIGGALYTEAVQTVVAELTQQSMATGAVGAASATSPASPEAAGSNEPEAAQPTQPPAEAAPTAMPLPTNPPLPTDTPTATAAPANTATPTTALLPSATPAGSDPRASLGGATFKDPFNDGRNWSFSKDDRTGMEVKDGYVEMMAYNDDYYYGWTVSWPKVQDFYLEITAVTGSECSGLDKYGLIFRSPDPSQGYLAGLSCDGRFALWYFDGKGETDLIDWTKNDAILAGPNQTNRLGVRVKGNEISVYTNGVLLGAVSDTKYPDEGKFGLFVGAVKTKNFMTKVDVLEYWNLK